MRMSKSIISILKVAVSIGLAGTLLYFVFQNVDWVDFWKKANQVDYRWVYFSIFLSLVAYIARAYRWNILLEPLGYNLKTSRTTLAVMVGYLANLAFPRLGEITRCGMLNRNDKVEMPAAFGSVVSERILDLLMLLLLMLVSLFLESERLLGFLGDAYSDLQIPTYLIVLIAVVVVVGVVLLVLFIKKQDKVKGKAAGLVKSFIEGLLSLKDIKRPVGFVVSSLVIWVVYYLMSYTIVLALPETSHLGLGTGFMLLITGGIAMALPVQSGFGTFHGMIAGMLLLYNIDELTGKFLATLLHTSQLVAVALFGSIALIISFAIRRRESEH